MRIIFVESLRPFCNAKGVTPSSASTPATTPSLSFSKTVLTPYHNNMMTIGQTYTSSLTVEEKHLACNVGSGDLPVFATPMMMALMENAAMLCVASDLTENESTVGGQIASSHIKPTVQGKKVTATAELTAIEGRKLSFRITAQDEDGTIGEGTHLRFIVNKEKFLSKL